ncbi:uncharacterized protein LOC122144875 [Cyprinus carpio]|uniref:Uncharacterized protein LOC122144875 n=1 Tax=Cyprinus carpio TaxID=7962 RepID=A0A9Q9Y1Q4_CYPCA|nr:uncharacterized protein LOC122144875 [Cyprinus carpio]
MLRFFIELFRKKGVSGVDTDEESVFVMEGDSVTLYTDVKTNQHEDIKWYFYDTRIAQISGDLNDICTDVQCNEGTERFRDRLKLDHQTGSLTIMNITNTDSGDYELKISNSMSEKRFSVTVYDVPAERDDMKRKSVKEGESVTLDPVVVKNPNDLMTWYFNDICIAVVNGDQSRICTDDQWYERLKLDHQTGSLTIMNTRTTDSGEHKLQINSSRFSITRISIITIQNTTNDSYSNHTNAPVKNTSNDSSSNHTDAPVKNTTNDSSSNHTDAPVKNTTNDLSSNHTNALVTNTNNDSSSNHTEIEHASVSEV